MFFFLVLVVFRSFFFFFNDTATTEIYTLSLHDALPISQGPPAPHPGSHHGPGRGRRRGAVVLRARRRGGPPAPYTGRTGGGAPGPRLGRGRDPREPRPWGGLQRGSRRGGCHGRPAPPCR